MSPLHSATPAQRALAGVAVVVGAGILVVLAAIILTGMYARRLIREVDGLAAAARRLADERLPGVVQALRNGEQVMDDAEAAARWPQQAPRPSIAQIAAAQAAIASMHRSAIAAASAEAGLRSGFRQILGSLGRRNQSLLHRQLRIIDTLEKQASSPAALAELFTLDHLTTRMRRQAESLTILSGAAPGRSWSGPVPVVDVMRAAAAEVEDYTRVTVISDSEEAVAAPAVTDMIHLLAELIENATLFSPSSTRVEVRGQRVANGFAIEVEDRGLGIPPDQLRELNSQLASPPDFDLADADRLGLFVAGRLAGRHGVHVSLGPSPYRGTKAVVVLPDSVVVPAVQPGAGGQPVAGLAVGRAGRLDLRAPEVLSLAGAVLPGTPAADEVYASAPVTPTAPSTLHGLPRRVRPENQSAGEPGQPSRGDVPAARAEPVESPAPEAARSLAASLQNSWHRSRQDGDTPDSGSTASERPATRHDATAPDSASDSSDSEEW